MERDFRNWDWDLIGSTLQVLPLGFMKNVPINYCGYLFFFLVLLSVEGLKLIITLHS